jgi:tetratricopeptide (TPR) repeat protein
MAVYIQFLIGILSGVVLFIRKVLAKLQGFLNAAWQLVKAVIISISLAVKALLIKLWLAISSTWSVGSGKMKTAGSTGLGKAIFIAYVLGLIWIASAAIDAIKVPTGLSNFISNLPISPITFYIISVIFITLLMIILVTYLEFLNHERVVIKTVVTLILSLAILIIGIFFNEWMVPYVLIKYTPDETIWIIFISLLVLSTIIYILKQNHKEIIEYIEYLIAPILMHEMVKYFIEIIAKTISIIFANPISLTITTATVSLSLNYIYNLDLGEGITPVQSLIYKIVLPIVMAFLLCSFVLGLEGLSSSISRKYRINKKYIYFIIILLIIVHSYINLPEFFGSCEDSSKNCTSKAFEFYNLGYANETSIIPNYDNMTYNYQEALKLSVWACIYNPFNPIPCEIKGDVFRHTGKIEHKLNNYIIAIRHYDNAIRLDPTYALAWDNKGIALDNLGDYEEALKTYDEAINLSNDAMAWNHKGLALYHQGKYDEAVWAFDNATWLDSKYADAWYNKGVALDNQGKYDEAIQAFNESVKLDPNYADAWYNKGVALYHQGKYDEAIQAFNESIELDPNYAEAWSNKGLALYHQSKYDEAIKACDKAIQLKPYLADAWNNKGVALYHQGKYEEAIKACDNAIQLKPYLADAWDNKGLALKSLGRTTEAESAFAQAKDLGYKG